MGQTEKNSVRAYVFRFALELGHRSVLRRNPFRPFMADFIEARVRLRERRHIKGSIASGFLHYTRGCGRIARPAFPAPSDFGRARFTGKTSRVSAARSRFRVCGDVAV